jgi:hypothetical protein
VAFLVTAADRAAFKRCRRQWDFSATARRRLSPLQPTYDLDRAVRDALAVYYFPGMWDWNSTIVLPLVVKALDDSLIRQRQAVAASPDGGGDDVEWQAMQEAGHLLLERYFVWAPTVDRFSPVRVATDFDANVPDLDDPDRYLVGSDGAEVRYTGRIDLLAIDEYDRYWIVRHRVTDEPFPATEQLLLDEESVAACWAWAHFYDGMEIAGTIYNELSPDSGASAGQGAMQYPLAEHMRGGLPQHEPSGGGRGISSPRRLYVKGRPEERAERIRQNEGDGLRRTAIRRTQAEVRSAGIRLAEEATDMVQGDIRTYPNPSRSHCPLCAFIPPCLAINEGRDVEPILDTSYRQRPEVEVELGRLGGTPHGVGRGWVPAPRGHGRG